MDNISMFYPGYEDFEFLKEYIGRIFILVNPNLLGTCNDEQKKMILGKKLDSAFENNDNKDFKFDTETEESLKIFIQSVEKVIKSED